MSEPLVKQYQELLRESNRDKTRKENIKMLLSRNLFKEGMNKKKIRLPRVIKTEVKS